MFDLASDFKGQNLVHFYAGNQTTSFVRAPLTLRMENSTKNQISSSCICIALLMKTKNAAQSASQIKTRKQLGISSIKNQRFIILLLFHSVVVSSTKLLFVMYYVQFCYTSPLNVDWESPTPPLTTTSPDRDFAVSLSASSSSRSSLNET